MDQESEKKTEKTTAGDEIKKANIVNEEIPCVDMTSDTETDVDQSKDSKSVEINGCENSGKSSAKTSNSSLEDVNEDTSEELDVSSSDKVAEPSSPVPATKTTETKNSVKNDISGKCSPGAENMDSETNDESKSEPKSGDEKLKSDDSENCSDSKTNRVVKKRRSSVDDSEPMDVDESPKSSKKEETGKKSESLKSRKERKKSDNESSSEVASHKEKSQKVKSEDTSKEKKSEQKNEIKIKIKEEIPENHVEEKGNKEINHEDKKPENNIEVKKEKYTEEIKKEEKKPEDSEESKEKSKTNSPKESRTSLSNSTESKPKSEGSEKKKSKKNRTCEECGTTKGLKFQVVFQGKPRFLCSEVCCKSFKGKQKLAKSAPPSSAPPPPPEQKPTIETDTCAYCKKEVKGSKGYYPIVGEVKPLCTEECLLNYQESNAPKKKCSQCKVEIEDEFSCLSWETMEFCNEDCLGKYQSFLGSHCTCCQSPVQQTSLGKYCVCFGADIRQFCSGSCLEEFKKGLKVCSFCQKDLSSGLEGFLAPVGEKGMFKEFCTQQCMERYETMNNNSNPPQNQHCSFCRKSGIYKIQTKHGDKSAVLCSENCVAGYRYINKIFQKMCDTCYKFFDPEKDSEFLLQFEGVNKFYCSKPCMTLFVLSHRKIVPCTWCKVKKYNFDMIEKLDSSNQTQTYCSLNCISLYRVSVNATSAKSIRCDNCTKNLPAQYHLTMSDGSIRNFCTYPCVIHFQNQFTNVPTLTTTTPSNRQNASTLSTIAAKTTASGSTTPVISNVMSLAASSPRSPVPNLAAKLVPQKLVAAPARQASPLAIITTKAASPLQTVSTPTAATASTGSGVSQVVKEVIVKPPPPKSMKNKSVLCKPIMQTKGVSCKPHPCHKAVQTDESTLPSIIPIPVPIYVPTPVHMFSRPVPCPVPFPIPIPVPIFIPTTKDSPTQIMKHLKDIQDKIPSNPFEAELLMMAEMVAENDEEKGQTSENLYPSENFDEAPHIPALDSMAMNETALDVETALPSGIAPVIQKEQDAVSDTVEDYFLKDGRGHGQGKRSGTSHGRGRGRAKRARLEGPPPEEIDPFATMPLLEDQNSAHHSEPPDSAARLKVK